MSMLIRRIFVINNCKTQFNRISYYSSEPEHAECKNVGKIVHVAIMGAPNAGKSTLINKIIDRKICAASNKVHTTTKLIRAMCYYDDTQIIFLDTPGIITDKEQKKYNLPPSMLESCHKSLRCAQVVGVVHDVSSKYIKDSLHKDVVEILHSVREIPSFLIMNKVDKLNSKKQLLTIVRNLTNGYIAGNPIPGSNNQKKPERGYSHFSDVFMVSALNGDGVSDIRDYLVRNAQPGKFHYSPEQWTDQTPKSIIKDAVRAKFLDFLNQEIPYSLKVQLDYFEEIENEDKILCSVSVECPSERLMRLISGAGGGRLQQIKTGIRNDLMDIFKKAVTLDLQLHIDDDDKFQYLLQATELATNARELVDSYHCGANYHSALDKLKRRFAREELMEENYERALLDSGDLKYVTQKLQLPVLASEKIVLDKEIICGYLPRVKNGN